MKNIMILIAVAMLMAGCKTSPNDAQEGAGTAQSSEQAAPAQTREVRRRSEPTEQDRTETASTQQASNRSDDPSIHLPTFEGSLDTEGYGLDMVLDGSSPESFQQSLEMIALESSPEQYKKITQALGYLRYTNLAFQDLNTLYGHLDGMTGREVIEFARSEGENR